MSISQYSDDDLLEEVKHRGFEIKIIGLRPGKPKVRIGGIIFELTT